MKPPLRLRLCQLLESNQGWASRLFNAGLMLLIFANVAAVLAESMQPVYLVYQQQFFWFEVVSVALFSVEYLARVWVAPDNPEFAHRRHPRLAFMGSGMAIVDLLAIAPFYLGLLVGIDTRILRGLRLLRIFKMTRYSSAMELLFTVMRKELPNIASAMCVMSILIVLAASGMYVVERDIQPEAFGSIPAALWWATVTLTTVGYGDVIPMSAPGRAFGMLLMLTGVGLAALPAAILASGYSRELTLRREQFEAELKGVLKNGHISHRELKHLEKIKTELGISDEEMQALRRLMGELPFRCPHCGETIIERGGPV